MINIIMTKLLVFGTFDLLHEGHKYFLNEAESRGDELFVVVALDSTVKTVKGFFPNQDEKERKRNVEGLKIAKKFF